MRQGAENIFLEPTKKSKFLILLYSDALRFAQLQR